MTEREDNALELSASILGRTTVVLEDLDLFVQEYGLALLRAEHPLPPNAAGLIAKAVADCRELITMAVRLRQVLASE